MNALLNRHTSCVSTRVARDYGRGLLFAKSRYGHPRNSTALLIPKVSYQDTRYDGNTARYGVRVISILSRFLKIRGIRKHDTPPAAKRGVAAGAYHVWDPGVGKDTAGFIGFLKTPIRQKRYGRGRFILKNKENLTWRV
jgi:hypothetical protein